MWAYSTVWLRLSRIPASHLPSHIVDKRAAELQQMTVQTIGHNCRRLLGRFADMSYHHACRLSHLGQPSTPSESQCAAIYCRIEIPLLKLIYLQAHILQLDEHKANDISAFLLTLLTVYADMPQLPKEVDIAGGPAQSHMCFAAGTRTSMVL